MTNRWILQNQSSAGAIGKASFGKWKYLQLAQPTNMETPAIALYQFDGTDNALTDRTGNGYILTMSNGNAQYALAQNLMGFYFIGSNRMWHNATPAPLQLDRAITVEMQIQFLRINTAEEHLFSISGVNEVLKENELCQLSRAPNTGILTHFVEYGSGTNSSAASTLSVANSELLLITFTRDSDGLASSFYINGENAATANLSNAAGKDTSGNLQKLYIGNTTLIAIVPSVKITPATFTAAQVLESYYSLLS